MFELLRGLHENMEHLYGGVRRPLRSITEFRFVSSFYPSLGHCVIERCFDVIPWHSLKKTNTTLVGRVRTNCRLPLTCCVVAVLLPPSALTQLSDAMSTSTTGESGPMLFQISNPRNGKKTHCGVIEFSAEEGCAYLPYWVWCYSLELPLLFPMQMFPQLGLEEAQQVYITGVTLPKGTFVKFQPQDPEFLEISNPRAVSVSLVRFFGILAFSLEYVLRSYVAMTVGDVLRISYLDHEYALRVLELRPAPAVSLFFTDIQVGSNAVSLCFSILVAIPRRSILPRRLAWTKTASVCHFFDSLYRTKLSSTQSLVLHADQRQPSPLGLPLLSPLRRHLPAHPLLPARPVPRLPHPPRALFA